MMSFNKFLKGSLATVLACTLAACSSTASTATSDTAPEGTETEAPVVTSNTGGTAAIKIGGSGPLTGDTSVYGISVKNAAELAVAEINAKGGVQFELNIQDDQAEGEKAVSAYNTLIDWGMQVSLATVTSGAGQAVSPSYQADNIFCITPSASSLNIIYASVDGSYGSDPYGVTFQMCFTDPNQGTASADYFAAHTELGTKVGVIYRSDDNYSTGLYTNFMTRAAEVGLEIVCEQAFVDSDTDYSVQVKACADAGAEIIFLPIYYQPAYQIILEASNQGYEVNFFGCDGLDGILTMEGVDASLCEGIYMLTPFSADATDTLTVNFVSAYEASYGETPTQFAADAYDCIYAIYQAVEAAGITAEMSQDEITEKIIEQFTSMTFDGVTGTGTTWAATGEVTKDPKAIVIENGVYVAAD